MDFTDKQEFSKIFDKILEKYNNMKLNVPAPLNQSKSLIFKKKNQIL
jgi:hypothetical protein